MQDLKSCAWLPQFCRAFGVLCEGSSAGFLLRAPPAEPQRFRKILARSARRGGARTRLLRTGFFSSHLVLLLHLIKSIRKAPDTFKFLRNVMRANLSVRPKCSHRCVSLKETPLKPVKVLKHTTNNSAEQTSMRTKWFKHIAI